jgi:ABC-2 type transport system permease protein
VSALVRAELLKLRTVQMTSWLFATTLLVVLLELMGFVLANEDGAGPGQRYDPDLLSFAVASTSAGEVIVMILGIVALSHEFRFGTATSTFLVTPRRSRVIVAKVAAIALVGLAFAAASMLIAVPLSVWMINERDGIVTWDARVGEALLGAAFVMVVYGPLGIAIGALVRNQIAAIAGSLTWLFIVEQAFAVLLPDLVRWTPGGATSSALMVGTVAGGESPEPMWVGVLLLLGWTVGLVGIGARAVGRRDLA